MKNLIYLIIFFIFLVISCSKSELENLEKDIVIDEIVNLPPIDFGINIQTVKHNLAILYWTKASDPENEAVSYSIVLNNTLLKDNIKEQFFTLENLSEETDYNGFVTAKDSFGNETKQSFKFRTLKYFFMFQKEYYNTENGDLPNYIPQTMLKTSKGEYIVVGTILNSYSTLFAMKVDYNGNEIWKNEYDYPVDGSNHIKIDMTLDGGILIGNRHVVLKIDDDGNKLWHSIIESYIDHNYDFFFTYGQMRSVKQDSHGDIYIIGMRQSFLPNIGTEGVLTKLNSNGTLIWEKAYHYGETYNDFDDLIINSSDDIIILGTTDTSGATYEEVQSGNINISDAYEVDYWLLKVNSSGVILWEKTYGDLKFDFARQIIETNNKDIVFAGFSKGAYDISNGTVYRLDSNGNLLWSTTTGLSLTLSIAEMQDGSLVSTGEVDGLDTNYFAINKLSNSGDLIWHNDFGTILFNIVGNSILAEDDTGFRIAAGVRFNPKIMLLKTDSEGHFN